MCAEIGGRRSVELVSRGSKSIAMIEIDCKLDGITAIRHSGSITIREFADLASTVADLALQDRGLLLFDWLQVEHWLFSSPNAVDVTAWRKAAKAIRRVAIVHDHRLNRQAAWLGAVLRDRGVTVRSWHPPDAVLAVAWLRAESLDNSVDSTRWRSL